MLTRRLLLLIIAVVVLAACGSKDPEGFQDPTATFEPGASTVDILLPRNSTIVYSEAIQISGRLADNAQRFTVRLVTPDGQTLSESPVDAQPGDWQVEVAHGYDGDPTEAEIQAVAADGQIYDTTSIVLSRITHRPEGAFASIVVPLEGDTVGGDLIPVEGRASGVEGNSLTVELVDSNNTVIDSQTLALDNPFVLDEVPWNAELNRGQATGSATIRISAKGSDGGSETEYDRIAVVLTEAAG